MVFRALSFTGPRGRCLNTSPQGGGGGCSNTFKYLPRDPANVNARKNMVNRYSCINRLYSFGLSDL